jgi:PKD repeat protein
VLGVLLALALASLLGASSAGATLVYGSNESAQLIAVDLTAGTTAVVGTLLFGTQAMDQDPATGYVYYFERTAGGDQFAYWNPATGTNTVVRTYVPAPGFFVKRMAFAPSGTLYMMDHADRLYTIDKTNGDIVRLGKVTGLVSGTVGGTGDMAFAPDGTLWLVSYQNLYTVNLATRAATLHYANLIPATSGQRVFGGLAFCDGTLYASDLVEATASSSVLHLDPATGTVTPLFPSVGLLNDLTSCPASSGGVAPTAAFSAAPLAGEAPLTVSFTDTSGGSPTQWAWDFQNDGVVDSTARNPQFTYTVPGIYSVKLTVSNAHGSDDEVKADLVTVATPPPPTAPTAAFSAAPLAGTAPLQVQFTDASSGAPTSWAWDFQNDGVVDSTVANPQFTYTAPGTYSVRLVVSNAQGSDEELKVNLVAVSAPPPQTTFEPAADAFVSSSNASANFGLSTSLRARPGVISHLRFTVTGTSGTSRATLRLFVTDATAGTVGAYAVSDASWGETSITWNTAPAVGPLLGSTTAPATGVWVEIDLGTIPGDGAYAFALQNPSTDVVWFSSREGANPPQLVVSPA